MKSPKKVYNGNLIIIVIALVLFCFGYYKSRIDKNKLKEFAITNGKIVEINKRLQRGYFVKYIYTVSTKQYSRNQSLTIKKELVKVGDVFEVKYSIEDNSVSELNFKKKINNE
ncbi:hypothetical protein [Zunongwangia sp.]|uniref:hypothetical protein n=1 Tax=Zunongwangia sp. TaxID=1965325 RepID=UPI003AA7DA43